MKEGEIDLMAFLFNQHAKDLRRAEPYVAEDGIYMPIHEYVYEGTAPEYKLVLTKEMFQEAFYEYIVKEGLNVQSKKQKD